MLYPAELPSRTIVGSEWISETAGQAVLRAVVMAAGRKGVLGLATMGCRKPMKLPADAILAREKIIHYLLVRQSRGDKSAFLERAGYSPANPDALIAALVVIRDGGEAQQIDENEFGRYYEVIGVLRGPSGVVLRVRTIWMTEYLSQVTKFITLIPIEVVDR